MAPARRAERLPRARLDVIEQAVYLGEEADEELALRFIDAVDTAVRRLAATPDIGRLRESGSSRLAGLRSWPVPGFPNHLIFYRTGEELLQIVRVVHGARDLIRLLDDQM